MGLQLRFVDVTQATYFNRFSQTIAIVPARIAYPMVGDILLGATTMV